MTKKTISLKCNCGAGHKITCPNCSEIKMVILLKNGFSHLKIKTGNNKKVNPVWYNHLSKNLKNENTIINGMARRFKKSEYVDKVNVLNFYSNTSGQLIQSLKF